MGNIKGVLVVLADNVRNNCVGSNISFWSLIFLHNYIK